MELFLLEKDDMGHTHMVCVSNRFDFGDAHKLG